MKKSWWKILAVVLLLYTFTAGLLIKVPIIGNLHQTIRNLFYHVPIWFAMLFQMGYSVVFAIKHLAKNDLRSDIVSNQAAQTGLFFALPGLLTGCMWAKYTWGTI